MRMVTETASELSAPGRIFQLRGYLKKGRQVESTACATFGAIIKVDH
jgi:hypothetical protein